MRYKPIVREADAFQQPVTADKSGAMLARAFEPAAQVGEAVGLGRGMWNTTLRLL